MQRKILSVFKSPLIKCPRPRRLLIELGKYHHVSYICPPQIDEKSDSRRYGFLIKNIQSPFLRWLNKIAIKMGWVSLAAWLEQKRYKLPEVIDGEFDYIFVHDLYLLPFFVNFKKSKIVFDAREFYPLEFSDDPVWASTKGKLADYSCKKYMTKADVVMSVSPSIVRLFESLLKRDVLLFPSYPRQELLIQANLDKSISKPIRFIHHGNAFANRGLEKMIELMKELGPEYQLDMMLVSMPGNKYFERLKESAKYIYNVDIIDPVHPDQITAVCSQYDMGLYLMEVNESQNRYCLPNKYFEFLFAGLPVITSFSQDMKFYTDKFCFGLGFADESIMEIANDIRALTIDDIRGFRTNIAQSVSQWNTLNNLKSNFPELFTAAEIQKGND